MALSANELRIGNFFTTEDGSIHTVNDRNIRYTAGMLPIPLSPDVLEKCGFENTLGSRYFSIGKFSIEWAKDNTFWFDTSRGYEFEVESLHQLQNLYFALTGEELEVSLDKQLPTEFDTCEFCGFEDCNCFDE